MAPVLPHEAALAYAALGWRVFPCDPHPEKPRSKRPLVVADKGPDGKPIEGAGWPGGYVVDLDPKDEPVETGP